MATSTVGTLWIGDRDYTLDDLSLGEIEDFETAMGAPIADVDLRSAKAIIQLVYMVKRREDATYTLEQARAVRISDVIKPEEEPAPLGTGSTDAATAAPATEPTAASDPATSGAPAS